MVCFCFSLPSMLLRRGTVGKLKGKGVLHNPLLNVLGCLSAKLVIIFYEAHYISVSAYVMVFNVNSTVRITTSEFIHTWTCCLIIMYRVLSQAQGSRCLGLTPGGAAPELSEPGHVTQPLGACVLGVLVPSLWPRYIAWNSSLKIIGAPNV